MPPPSVIIIFRPLTANIHATTSTPGSITTPRAKTRCSVAIAFRRHICSILNHLAKQEAPRLMAVSRETHPAQSRLSVLEAHILFRQYCCLMLTLVTHG